MKGGSAEITILCFFTWHDSLFTMENFILRWGPLLPFFLGVLEVNDKFYFIKNNSERPLDALAEKHHLLTD